MPSMPDRAAAILAMRRCVEAQCLLDEAKRLLNRARRSEGAQLDHLLERARSLRERSEALGLAAAALVSTNSCVG
jgi:hypothetical protein